MRTEVHASPLDPFIASFEASLAAKNYKPRTLRTYRWMLRCIGGIMEAKSIDPSVLTPDLAVALARRLPASRGGQVKAPNLAKRFAEHLIGIGVALPLPVTETQAQRTDLLAAFETYLVRQRGLSSRTIYHTLRFANRFLDHRFGSGMMDMPGLKAGDVVAFMEHLFARKRPLRDKTPGSHLRSFFQYLFARGMTPTDLSLCVPRMRKAWGARLPRYLSSDEVESVLVSARTNPRCGVRDYAMLLVMARLGLRAPEVIAIQLDDIEWRAGELLVRGKGQRHDRLPLPHDVGAAISRYLQTERTSAITRTLFVTHRAPKRPFKDSQIINSIIKQAFAATGVKPPAPYVGSHVLRHSLATSMVRAGASLDEVGDLLRHRCRATTMIYAKLDTEGTSLDRSTVADLGDTAMSLHSELNRYLSVRRQLGADLATDQRILHRFVTYADRDSAASVDTDLVLRWLGSLAAASPGTRATRFRVVRIFAEWLHGIDPRHKAPPRGLIPGHVQRAAPHIYSDAEIIAIVDQASALPSIYGMRGLTCATLFGLIAVTGLRISEALGLDASDLDAGSGILHVRHGKLGKERLLPLDPSVVQRLVAYGAERDRLLGGGPRRSSSPAKGAVWETAARATILPRSASGSAFESRNAMAGMDMGRASTISVTPSR